MPTSIGWSRATLTPKKMQFQIEFRPATPSKRQPNEISSYHSGGVNAAFCDGSVQFLSDRIDPRILKAMTTIDGGETVIPPEY